MTIDKKKLRELASKATPGNWHAADCISPQIVLYAVPADKAALRTVGEDDVLYLGRTYADGAGQGRANLKFIAAANPAAVIELLDENEKFRADSDRLRAFEARHGLTFEDIEHPDMTWHNTAAVDAVREERDRLKDENEKLRRLLTETLMIARSAVEVIESEPMVDLDGESPEVRARLTEIEREAGLP